MYYLLRKLFTHEDAAFFHAHKILGLYCLVHFAYRILSFFGVGGVHGGFADGSVMSVATLIPHFLLHASSFQFKLSPRRNHAYNIIWPEMRWHTMIFAFRSLLAMLCALWFPRARVLRGMLVLGTMLAADATTAYYKKRELVDRSDSTMRGMPYAAGTPAAVRKAVNLFYSTSQVFATVTILSRDPNGIFLVLLPIQTAPLGMTLVRKGLLDQTGWHIFYASTLLLNYAYGWTLSSRTPLYSTSVLFFCAMRFIFGVDKYLLWIPIIAANTYFVR